MTDPNFETFKYRNYNCMIKTNSLGCLLGYIILPTDDLYYRGAKTDNYMDLPIHGGVTYAEVNQATGQFMIGFDTAHAYDYIPGLRVDGHRWDAYEVREELTHAVDWIIANR